MELIFTILIVYLAYKVMFQPKNIAPPSERKKVDDKKKREEGEYVDYEEVE